MFYIFQGHITDGSPEEAITLFHEMSCLGLEPDRHTYNTLILASMKSEKLDVALSFFEKMKVASMYMKGQFCAFEYL